MDVGGAVEEGLDQNAQTIVVGAPLGDESFQIHGPGQLIHRPDTYDPALTSMTPVDKIGQQSQHHFALAPKRLGRPSVSR